LTSVLEGGEGSASHPGRIDAYKLYESYVRTKVRA